VYANEPWAGRVRPAVSAGDLTFAGVAALLFSSSVAMTIVACTPTLAGMQLCGSMSVAPGQGWFESGLSFVAMWTVMMVAMMLPSLMPVLCRYRDEARGVTRLGLATSLVGVGYFFVWALLGVLVLLLGLGERVMPAGVVLLFAGALQFTGWKARMLACCRDMAGGEGGAFVYGVRHGLHCAACCAGPTAVLLVLGLMDLRVMAVVTAAITAERLFGLQVARALGVVAVGAGLALLAGV
jgi:predicted metal-binding membrane protein